MISTLIVPGFQLLSAMTGGCYIRVNHQNMGTVSVNTIYWTNINNCQLVVGPEFGFKALIHVAHQTLRNVPLLPLANICWLVLPPEIFRTGSTFFNTMRKWVGHGLVWKSGTIKIHKIHWCIIIFPFKKTSKKGSSHPTSHIPPADQEKTPSFRVNRSSIRVKVILTMSPAVFPAVTREKKLSGKPHCSCEPLTIPISLY